MGKKSGPAAPTPPDPVATANAQAAANKDAAITQAGLNRVNQVTPQGSITWSQNGVDANGIPQYTQTQTYSPEQQALYNQQNQVAQGLGNLATDNISRVAQAQSTPFSFDGMTPLQTSAGGGQLQYGTANPQAKTDVGWAGGIQSTYGNGGQIQNSFGQGGPLQSNVQAGQVQNQIANGGNIQGNLNFGGQFNPGDFNQTSQAAANAAYDQAASRLNPQFQQQESDMRARLANSGISENSDAFRREMDNFNRGRTDAFNQATYSSIAAGLAAQNQGYNQSLGTRQQNTGETAQAGQFNNQAQQQQFNQNAAQQAAYNQAQNQQFQQGQQNAALNNQAQGQQWQQNLGQAQFSNQAQQQQNTQNQQAAQFGNQAQDQQFQQNLAGTGFYNQAQSQNFQQAQQNAQMNNTTQNQQFNQNLANAQLNNNARQQQIQEASWLRNLPLNDIAALLGTGGGVQNPTFNDFAQVGVAAPDYQGAVYANYNAANQQYQQAQANRSAGLGGLFGLAGSAAMAFSDARIKTHIRRIGELANGVATYVFKYAGSKIDQFGVMAQDVLRVMPEAVGVTSNGTLFVDYSKVYNG